MKFKMGDETDRALTTTLVHELVLCNDSFERFAKLARLNIAGRRDKLTKIRCHDAYATFLHHLYEFYAGRIARDCSDTNVPSAILDRTFNGEIEKALRRRVDAIERGTAPSWENQIAVYLVNVPEEFGTQFRKIRNRTAHASHRRSVPGAELSLFEFYEKYHLFIYLLYVDGKWLWSVDDVESRDWKAIEEFDLAISSPN
jgi:hypothetical protein